MNKEYLTVEGGDAKLNVVVEGDPSNPAVVLHHSLGGDQSQFDKIAPALIADYFVVRYDCRGHGGSDAPEDEYKLETLADDAVRVLNALEIRSCAFVGLSLGGVVAMQLALNAPERIDSLVLANTTTFIPNKQMWRDSVALANAEGMNAIARPTLEKWFSESFREANPSEFDVHVEIFKNMPKEGYIGCCAVLRDVDLRDQISSIAAPALVIAGAEDMPHAIEGAKAMASAIPNAEYALIKDGAHLTPIENPSDLSNVLLAFLRADGWPNR